jgi:HK97 family phage major capsid protein
LNAKELREKRARLVNEARAVHERAVAEKREMTADESAQFDRIHAEVDALKGHIDRLERQERHEFELSVPQPTIGGGPVLANDVAPSPTADPGLSMRSLNRLITSGIRGLDREELRSLQSDSSTAGGYINTPQLFVAELLKAVDNLVIMRQISRVIPLNGAESIGVPEMTARAAAASWGGEITLAPEDTSLAFGKREMQPKRLSSLIKVSMKLLQTAAISPEQIVRDEFAYTFGVTQETAFMTGNGAGQPLGVFTASAQGISTARDVSTGNTSTAIGADNLFENFYSLKQQYQRSASWLFHRDAVKQIRKLKDGNGQYLWAPGITGGQPDTILSRPVYQSEYAPNTFTAGLYVGLVGDFRNYWIADGLAFQLQRLDELYATTDQIGFIGRAYVDGAPVREEAFSRVKLA